MDLFDAIIKILLILYFYSNSKLDPLKFSTKTRYGIRTMIEIASDKTEKGVFQKDIAENQDLSIKYLDHIIHGLKGAGLISTVKGKKSGYILTKSPSDISMFDIHNAFENGICVIDCMALDFKCEKEEHCKTQPFWKGLNKVVLEYFQNTTLEDLIRQGTVE